MNLELEGWKLILIGEKWILISFKLKLIVLEVKTCWNIDRWLDLLSWDSLILFLGIFEGRGFILIW